MKTLNLKTLLKAVSLSAALSVTALANAELVAIEGATIHTQTSDGVLKNATIIIEDGEITAIGKAVRIPRGATILAGKGKVVTPGIIDPFSYLGLVEINGVTESVDTRTKNESHGAGFDIASAINPRSTLVPVSRIEGITHAVTAPSPSHSIFAGQGAAFHLGSETDESNIIKNAVAVYANVDQRGAGIAGGSRASAFLALREALDDAKAYADNKDAYDSASLRELSASRLDLEALQGVVDGDTPLVVSVVRSNDIRQAVKLADDYNLKLVIEGAEEAWMVAKLLADNDVAVILDPLSNLPSNFNSLGSRLDNAARLHKAGVTILIGDGNSHNARNLKQLAGNAVANGLPWDAALEALTKNAVDVFGLDGLGEIEVGDKANLVLWDGDPLEVTTFADQVFINGETIPMVSRSTLLRDRYMPKEDSSDMPKAYTKP